MWIPPPIWREYVFEKILGYIISLTQNSCHVRQTKTSNGSSSRCIWELQWKLGCNCCAPDSIDLDNTIYPFQKAKTGNDRSNEYPIWLKSAPLQLNFTHVSLNHWNSSVSVLVVWPAQVSTALVGQKECFEEEVTDFGVRPHFGGRYLNIPRKNSLADQPVNCKCCLVRNDIKLVGFCRPTTGWLHRSDRIYSIYTAAFPTEWDNFSKQIEKRGHKRIPSNSKNNHGMPFRIIPFRIPYAHQMHPFPLGPTLDIYHGTGTIFLQVKHVNTFEVSSLVRFARHRNGNCSDWIAEILRWVAELSCKSIFSLDSGLYKPEVYHGTWNWWLKDIIRYSILFFSGVHF